MRTFLVLLFGVLLVATASVVCAQSQPRELSYTRREVLRKTRDAKSAADFADLAHFYEGQSKYFRAAAKGQQHERAYYDNHDGGKQYPLASERARLLHEYYETRAKEDDALAKHYRERAEAVSTPQAKEVSPANGTVTAAPK